MTEYYCEDCLFYKPWVVHIPERGPVEVEGMGFCEKSSHWQKVCHPVRDDIDQCGPEGKWFKERSVAND